MLAGGQADAALAKLAEARAIREPIAATRRQQAVYARGLARLYTDTGDARVMQAKRSPASAGRWRDARQSYRDALDLWTELRHRNALWATEREKPEEVSRKMAACDADAGRD